MSTPDNGLGADEVRDLLGELGRSLSGESPETTMPPEISARIEAALADLPALTPPSSDDEGPERPAVVVPLRRRVGPWLVAAAVVVVVGGGGWALTHRDSSSNANASASSAAADSAGTAGGSVTKSAPAPLNQGRRALPSLTTADFHAGVEELLASTASNQLSDQLSGSAGALEDFSAQADTPSPTGGSRDLRAQKRTLDKRVPQGYAAPTVADCTRPTKVAGRQIEVSLDGQLAQLILSRSGGHQVVTAYDCAGAQVLAATTLP